ncbi:conserved domain protein [Synechococcus sp. PCC 7335]|uniref:DUF1830 domain-containing protein n=1 Tax=Synechococcus sp. (strain ATCC 29403 / PCC 7335) TaxID=91464 RepID=UPI00017EC7E2|nr:DUF1830 domain-containing protein [Synechococcus sp. PCC 7335]EDX83397.1 conserved domain protein [Synechococcus sp. PCC 7335]
MRNNVVEINPSGDLRITSQRTVAIKTVHFSRNGSIQCCYTNHTQQFQIIRMATAAGSFLERAVPPQGHAFFEAGLQDHLEVHTGNPITSILADRIPCEQLAIWAS